VLDLAIGQQQIVTPLQLAVMSGALGNGRFSYKPRLLKEVINHEKDTTREVESEILDSISLKDTAAVTSIRHAMREVILPGGTGWRAGVKGIPVGGKTGSAENPHGENTHALFIACAPVDDPVISIAVAVENAGHGGSVAAPIAGDVLRYFFNETERGKAISEEYSKREDWE
ncbi:MAG: penicillin-binding transpeptidase domain-containing protein, partial [Chitinivibrionales bacterium]